MGLHPLAKALDQIRADAARAMLSGHGNSPQKIADAEALFDQTALAAFPSSARLMELGLDPALVLADMLAKARQSSATSATRRWPRRSSRWSSTRRWSGC